MQALRSVTVAFMTAVGILGPTIAQANEACVKKHLSNTAFRLDVKLGAPAETDEQRIAAFLQRVGSDLSPNDYAGLCRFLNSDSGAAALANAKWRVFEEQAVEDQSDPYSSPLTEAKKLVSDESKELANSIKKYKLTRYYIRDANLKRNQNSIFDRSISNDITLDFYHSGAMSNPLGGGIIGNYLADFEFISAITIHLDYSNQEIEAHLFVPFNSTDFDKERLRADPNLVASKVSSEIDDLLEPLDSYRLLRIRPGTEVCAAKLSYILDEDERERVKIVFDYARSLAQAKRGKDRTDFDNALKAFVPECT